MKFKKKNIFIIFMLVLSIMTLVNLYIKVPKIKEEISVNIKENMISSISSIIKNFERHIQEELKSSPKLTLVEIFKNSSITREHFESELNLLVTNDIKYAFMLYRDSKNRFRFLLDGSIKDKIDLGIKFNTRNNTWNRVYNSKKAQMIEQHDLSELWITYIVPILYENNVVGVVAVDLSFDKQKNTLEILQPLKDNLMVVIGLISIIILVALAQYVLYYFSQKRVYIDALTKVKNRQYLNDILPTIEFKKYHIAMLDIDRFKLINDTYGHDVGDDVLKEISTALSSSTRSEDHLVRYGGEEFILLMPLGKLSKKNAFLLLERLRERIGKITILANDEEIKPTISIGANLSTKESNNVYDAIKLADNKLYEAKQQGRNRTIFS